MEGDDVVAQPTQPSEPAEPSAPSAPGAPTAVPTPMSPKPNSSKGLIVGAAVIIVIIIAGAGYLLLGSGQSGASTSTTAGTSIASTTVSSGGSAFSSCSGITLTAQDAGANVSKQCSWNGGILKISLMDNKVNSVVSFTNTATGSTNRVVAYYCSSSNLTAKYSSGTYNVSLKTMNGTIIPNVSGSCPSTPTTVTIV